MIASVAKFGYGSLLSLHKLSYSEPGVMMMAEDAPVKVSSTFWTVHKSLA